LQVAVTFALLVGAGLLARALRSSGEERIGATRQVATLHLDLTFADYDADSGRPFYDELIRRVRGVAGVEAAAYAARLPFGFGGTLATVAIPGFDPPDGQAGFRLDVNRISDGWPEVVKVPLTRGRGFTTADRADGPGVALINETMARRFWPDDDPLQRPLVVSGRPVDVVGVVDDTRFAVPGRPDMPRIYVSSAQVYSPRAVLMVRAGSQATIGGPLVQAVSELDPDIPIGAVGTLAGNINAAYLPQRLLGGATLAIGALTLVLAAFGLYGLLAYWVTTRRLELGIRSALGARSETVVGLAIRQGLVPTTWGVVGGLVLAVGVGLVLRRFLLGVSPLDPVAYLIAAAVFYVVATLACLVPARRAAAVSPMAVLRGP
jgi:predicted permease